MQLAFQLVDAALRRFVGAFNRRVHVHNQMQLAAQVVEHHDFIGHHQQNIRRADLVGRAAVAQALFDVAHGVVAEIAHQATVEPGGQFGQVRGGVKALLVVVHESQRVIDLCLFDHFAVAADFDAVVEDFQNFLLGKPMIE